MIECDPREQENRKMISNPQEVRALSQDLANSTWTLGAIGALLESGLVEHLRELRSVDELAALCPGMTRGRIERCVAVAATAGVVVAEGPRYRLAPGMMPFAQPPMRSVLQGEIRTTLMQVMALLDSSSDPRPLPGWRHTSAALLQSQGDASAMFAPALKASIAPSLGDLAARLERPGARFLDVGVGVASLTIAMCRAWPALHVVGLDTFDVPLGLARQNVERAGLADRVELRHVAVQDLHDEASFDLAWMPSFFIPAPVLASAAARVHAALRPGGWLLFPIGGLGGDDQRARAVFALINELWGGPVLFAAEAESLLKEAGFSTVRVLPGPASTPPFVVAQR
jgi:2-polyprenyl-3-methyl-5-hydroxy-6-metoxy-1,4-benzoquinol methylase